MTHAELLSWIEYYEEAPFDDAHRYHRPAVLISQSMGGGDIQSKIDFLIPPQVAESAGDFSDADMKTFVAFGAKPPRV